MMNQDKNPLRGRPPRDKNITENSKKHIIHTARLLFIKEGYAGVSMRRIAQLAECSPAFLYKLFPSKRHILLNLWEEVFEQLIGVIMECYRTTDKNNRLKNICLAYIDFWISRPDDYRSIFLIEDNPQNEDDLYFVESSIILKGFDRLKTIIIEAQQNGEIGSGDPALIQNLLFCGMQGLIMNLITIPEYAWGDQQIMKQSLIDVLLKGLK